LTALLSLDTTNFTLACDRCGQLVANLAPTMGDWDVAWSLFSQDGWSGDDLATGPHTCGRCARIPPPPRMVDQALERHRTTPIGRECRRVAVGRERDTVVVTLSGSPDLLVNARLRDLVLGLDGQVRHLVVDVTRVARLDSAALDVLVHAHRRRLTVCLAGPSGTVRDALRMLCLHRLFPTFPDRAQALSWVHSGAAARSTGRPESVEAR
jgi:anti-anti-sigma factor